ncbi:MAG: hypothetical protein PHG89_11675 [Gallionella sp.]|nr:hypothetical protein [Gallionella sp.]
MNAEVKAMPAQNQSMKPNQIMLIGRLDRVVKFKDRFDHIITLPAPDEYSKPSVVRVNAKKELGQPDTTVKCLAQFNGWPNEYKVDEEDERGNIRKRTVFDVKGFFVAVE